MVPPEAICSSCCPEGLAFSCAVKSAALSEAIRSGGFSISVPRAVLVLTLAPGLLLPLPQPASTLAKYTANSSVLNARIVISSC